MAKKYLPKGRPFVNNPLIPKPDKGRDPFTGKPVLDGSLDGPLGKGFGGVDPLGSNGSALDGTIVKDGLGRSLADLTGATSSMQGGNFMDFLSGLVSNGKVTSEVAALIIQAATQYGMAVDQRQYDNALTQDQRQYDWNMLQDSRIYNSPTNELARYMGAGISRDAALQLMSGNGSGSGVGSGSPVVSSVPTVQAMDTPGNQVASNAFSAISAVTELCQCGIGLTSAIEQVRGMKAQNYFTRNQMQSLQGVNEITQAFNSAVLNGILSVEDVQGLRTADDYYRYITDHAETDLCAPLIKSGAVGRVFGSTYGREFMNRHLQQTRDARDSAKLYDSFLNQQDMASELATITTASARRQYYLDWTKGLQELLQGDAELKLLYQQYRNGEKQISINGEILKQEQYRTKSAERADFFDDAQFQAGKKALERNYHINYDGYEKDVDGYELLNYHEFTKLLRSYQQDQALSGRQAVQYIDSQGNLNYVSARERYGRLLSENVNIAITGAFLQEVISSNRLSGYNGDLDWLYKFSDMWNASGLGGVVKTVGDFIP